MAWGPMGQGKYDFFNHPVLMSIGEKYGKTASQVGLRFLVQQRIPVIPKSVSIQRMKENINIFDFNLDESDMDMLRGLNIYDTGLLTLARVAKEQGLVIGEDISVISYNDAPINEIILDGLTAVSTDFRQMGETAADMILTKNLSKVKCDFRLIRRSTF